MPSLNFRSSTRWAAIRKCGLTSSALLYTPRAATSLGMGSSPIAQTQRVYAADPHLQRPDPRMAAVEYVRVHFPPASTAVTATERMAAHFTDYRTVYPLSKVRLADTISSAHVLVIDRSDAWDRIVRDKQLEMFLADARNAGYSLHHTEGPVLILTNR